MGDFDKATDWFKRVYERREPALFVSSFPQGFGYEKALETYRLTPGYKALGAKLLFREW